MNSIQIGRGHVHHSRHEGGRLNFRYPTFFLLFRCDLESPSATPESLQRLLRTKFLKLLSFSSRDYLNGRDLPLVDSIKIFLRKFCQYEAEEVWLQTMPRMLGFVFNPVSFWYCRRGEKLEAVLVEVNNTFGERHFYWIRPGREITSGEWFRAEKVFHVSPFFPVDGFYQFRFRIEPQRSRVDINYHEPSGPLRLATWVSGHLSPLSDQSPVSIFGRYGWMTALVVLRIHSQAFKLWLRKTRFYRKPALPAEEVSYERHIGQNKNVFADSQKSEIRNS